MVFSLFSQVASGTVRGNCLKLCLAELDWILGKISSLKGLSSTEPDCPGQQWIRHTWRDLKDFRCGTQEHGLVVNTTVPD